MKKKNFIISIFIFLILYFIVYIGLFYYQLESRMEAHYWAKNFHALKDYRVKEIGDKNKILIISGSNSHYAIDSELLENKIGLSVVNLAFWIGNDMKFFYYQIDNYVKPGDIVLMPLEFPYYYRTNMTTRFAHEMMVWGKSIYLDKLSINELFSFILNVEPKRLIEGLIHKIANQDNSILTDKQIEKNIMNLFKTGTAEYSNKYNATINKYGDKILDYYNYAEIKNTSYIMEREPSVHFVEEFEKIKKLVKKKGATLILTYPVTMRNELFNLTKKKFQKKVTDFERKLEKYNINIQCNAALSNMNKKFFFDSPNHVTKYGRAVRTENLISCLERVLNKKDNIDFNEAIYQTKILEEKYIKFVKKPDIPHYEKRFKDLSMIRNALKKYHEKYKTYPKSKGFDGLYSNWGYSGKDWINGLVPEYIKELPRDPRNTNSPLKQYLYKSNGKDYKLISHSAEDCNDVAKKKPELIDPKRRKPKNCSAYGFWTKGAETW